jgi:hypothetical protein
MQTLLKTLGRVIGSGSMSAAIAAARAPGEGSTPYAPLNAVTHCSWPRRALAERSRSTSLN